MFGHAYFGIDPFAVDWAVGTTPAPPATITAGDPKSKPKRITYREPDWRHVRIIGRAEGPELVVTHATAIVDRLPAMRVTLGRVSVRATARMVLAATRALDVALDERVITRAGARLAIAVRFAPMASTVLGSSVRARAVQNPTDDELLAVLLAADHYPED